MYVERASRNWFERVLDRTDSAHEVGESEREVGTGREVVVVVVVTGGGWVCRDERANVDDMFR